MGWATSGGEGEEIAACVLYFLLGRMFLESSVVRGGEGKGLIGGWEPECCLGDGIGLGVVFLCGFSGLWVLLLSSRLCLWEFLECSCCVDARWVEVVFSQK